jgi:hypothetical protein
MKELRASMGEEGVRWGCSLVDSLPNTFIGMGSISPALSKKKKRHPRKEEEWMIVSKLL